ncbi:MAG TPA: metallophosphoesterase [Clostridia bacterium]|nr:metallophosphoesterase [Clostridia bacterium]
MQFFKQKATKIAALFLALIFLFGAIPPGIFSALTTVQKTPLQIALISDTHHYPQVLMGSKGEAWEKYCKDNSTQHPQSSALLDTALNAIAVHAQENACKYVLLPGDLTKDGEYEGHLEMAARLEQFELETGIQVIVTNGNHDINNSNASTFENDKPEPARPTTPEEFRSIYSNLGFDLAYKTYTPPAGKKAGMLSFSVQLDGGYRLLVLDGCKYSADSSSKGIDEHESGGNYPPELWAWAKAEMADATSRGETVIGMTHHNIIKQFEVQPSMFQAFVIDKWLETAETLADAGMKYMFTGHMHMNNIASHTSDKGNIIYDCQTPSLTGFPNNFREVLLDNTGPIVKATFLSPDVDCEQAIIAQGVTYDQPYKYSFSFGQTFGKDGLASFGIGMANGFINSFIEGIQEQGGLYAMLTSASFDLEGILDDAIKGGLAFGSYDIFTVRNIMSFIEDLATQIDKVYIDHPETLLDVAHQAADKLVSLQVSDLPCTRFIDSIGFGDPGKPGTLEDAAYSVIATMYQGNEDISDDLFLQDVIDFFRNRDGAEKTYQLIKDVLLNDLIEDSILNVLDFNPATLFPNDSFIAVMGDILDAIFTSLFPNDRTYLNIINAILGLLPADYNSLEGIVDTVAQEYLTQSQFDSLGGTVADIIECLVVDEDPGFKMDYDITLACPTPAPVLATAENYRLPSQIAVTFGDTTHSSLNINWFTKYSVTGTDIELIPYSPAPVFTGNPTSGAGIECSSEKVLRGYPGADLGITGFLNYDFSLVRHAVKLTGLSPGQKYSYRVGDAAKGWWSQAGVIELADNTDTFAFFHMTDPQAQNKPQYKAWANVVDRAFKLYPQSKFIMSSGDLVDNQKNVKQWQWLLDTAADNLMNTALMPTAGNHEDKGFTLDETFLLPMAPEQDRDSGVYYSFDYNNAHFMVLNTNDLNEKNELSKPQLEWLKKDAAASKAQWKIVSLHKAIYSNGSHFKDKDVVTLRKQLASLMPALDIDLVLQGHDHVYLRTDAMKANKVVKSETELVQYQGLDYSAKLEPAGSIYVVSGCAGVKHYLAKSNSATDRLFPRAEKIVPIESPVFSAIQIDGANLYFDAYTVNGEKTKRIDNFAIKKEVLSTPTKPSENDSDNGDTVSDTEHNTIVHDKTDEIPPTGGSDMLLFAVLPLALSIFAVVDLNKKKKKGAKSV